MTDIEKSVEELLAQYKKMMSSFGSSALMNRNPNTRLSLEFDVDFDEAIELINHLKKMRHPDGEKAGEA